MRTLKQNPSFLAFLATLCCLTSSCPSNIENVNIAEAKASGLDYSFVIWRINLLKQIPSGQTIKVPVELLNNGNEAWLDDGEPYFLSYHWKHPGGQFNEEMFWGEKTILPTPIGQGEIVSVDMTIKTPEIPKFYVITIDIIRGESREREKAFWFEERGWKTYDKMIDVIKP